MDLVFENSTYCNQSCFFCPQGKFHLRNNVMSTEMFKGILDAIAPRTNMSLINFSGMGEPLTDPNFVDKVRYCWAFVEQVMFYTNGRLLTKDLLIQLRGFVQKIFVSVQGDTPEEYEAYSGYEFDKIVDTIKLARDIFKDPDGNQIIVVNHPHGKMAGLLGKVANPHPMHNWGDDEIAKATGSNLQGCNYPCSFGAIKVRVDGSLTICGQDWSMENDFLNENFPACQHCQHNGTLDGLRATSTWQDFKRLVEHINGVVTELRRKGW